MNIFVFGSSIVSCYWNGAATYYRGIYKYLAQRGHHITFAEPDAYERQQHRDNGDYSFVQSIVYRPGIDIDSMLRRAGQADVVIKHSGVGVDDALLEARVPELCHGRAVVFWDVDAPATIARVHGDESDPFLPQIPKYDAILSYGGGPVIAESYGKLGARSYHSIYNGLDPDTHHPELADSNLSCDVMFLGNRLPDREQRVEELFFRAAELAPQKQFVLGGEGWEGKSMPRNVRWIGHVPTDNHNRLNCSAGMVMNINRTSMANLGFSPPTRIFEVAGAGACLLCDDWPGVDDCFEPGRELLIVHCAEDVVEALEKYDPAARKRLGHALRLRALRDHTYASRAEATERILLNSLERRAVAAVGHSAA